MMFVCSGRILHQKIGLAMGGFCSPALAIIVCMMHEHSGNWCRANVVSPAQLAGVRFVDDMTAVIPAGAVAGVPHLASLLSTGLPAECE